MRITSGSSRAHGRVAPTSTNGSSRGVPASLTSCLPGSGWRRPPTHTRKRSGSWKRARTSATSSEVRGYIAAVAASGITTTCSRASRRCATASSATVSVGTITRAARCAARRRRRRRRPLRRCSLRRFSIPRSWIVTTIGHGLCSIAPSIHGEWNTSALRERASADGRCVSTIWSFAATVSRSASSRQRV